VKKTATVHTNDSANKTIPLQLSAKVTAFARYPRRITLSGKADEKIVVKHTIVPEPQFMFDIVRTYADNGSFISFSLEKQKSQFTLTVENKKNIAGRYWDKIHLVTNNNKKKEITIPVFGNIQDAVSTKESSTNKNQ